MLRSVSCTGNSMLITRPYGSAKDPVNMLGFIASNVMRGEFKQIFSDELQSLLSAENKAPFILDVREPEVRSYYIFG